MRIVPAVDLLDRQIVRLSQGDPDLAKTYSSDPLSAIDEMVKNGASMTHVVDLNAAIKKDVITNSEIINDILDRFSRKSGIQIAGGIGNPERANSLIMKGAKRVVIGSVAYSNIEYAKQILRLVGEGSTVLALDYDHSNRIRTAGWIKEEREIVNDAILRFAKIGFSNFLLTAVERDGMMSGPDFETLGMIRNRNLRIKIFASGGISSLDDVSKLANIGIDEAIIGKAIYERKIPLSALRSEVK